MPKGAHAHKQTPTERRSRQFGIERYRLKARSAKQSGITSEGVIHVMLNTQMLPPVHGYRIVRIARHAYRVAAGAGAATVRGGTAEKDFAGWHVCMPPNA